MNNITPLYIGEHLYDMRGINEWYAVEKNGNLVSGPFYHCDDCLKLFNPISGGAPNAHASVRT